MAEKGNSREAPIIARRPSFRKSLREIEATLPLEYLEVLEQKRKQLDESIHKYIAAKERDYKQYEKDLRQQAKASGASPALAAQLDGPTPGSVSQSKRRTSEAAQDALSSSPLLLGQQSSAVNALLASGLRRETPGPLTRDDNGMQSLSAVGPIDRRTATEREKDFIGLFTPPFLPAIDDKGVRQRERTESAPAAVELSSSRDGVAATRESLPKTESDSAIQAQAKRPVHLQIARRTSSSGSSADGKLTSAMKSPKGALGAKPKKKRVSLAVGDSIVAPSDDAPLLHSNTSTPSHSRSRSPVQERKPVVATVPATSIADFVRNPPITSIQRVEEIMNGTSAIATGMNKDSSAAPHTTAALASAVDTMSTQRSPSKIDADGDLFDLEEDSDLPPPMVESDDFDSAIEGEDDVRSGVAGRVEDLADRPERGAVSVNGNGPKPGEHYDSEAGLIPEPTDAPAPASNGDDDHAVHLEYGPNSSSSSQHPTSSGFRRPSVISDPVFKGSDYANAEAKAADDETYGSSYSRPPTKGSFTGGSLGESYMAKHAEDMMRLRVAKQQQSVQS